MKHFRDMEEILQLILFLGTLTLVLVIYVHQQVDMAVIKRQIHKLSGQKKELQSRNHALKKALGKLARDMDSLYWQSYPEFAPYEKNKVVRIKLPPPP